MAWRKTLACDVKVGDVINVFGMFERTVQRVYREPFDFISFEFPNDPDRYRTTLDVQVPVRVKVG